MEKVKIFEVFNCNRVLYKLIEQKNIFPISIGLTLFRLSKIFDEVEDYIFKVMDITFDNFYFENMTDEQKEFFNKLMTEEIEIEYKKIPLKVFENNNELKLSIDEIGYLSIILEENIE